MTEQDRRPPVRRIADDLREQIADGQLPPGGKLPANRELATRYRVTRMTASRAVSLLATEGLVETRHGSGAYVREPHPIRRLGPDRYARHKWQVTTVETFADDTPGSDNTRQQGGQTQDVRLVQADEQIAETLSVEPGASVYERARLVTREGTPTHTVASYYLPGDVEGTPIVDQSPGIAGGGGGFQVLTDQGLEPSQITEDLHARMPTPDEVRELKLDAGPVVELFRVTRTDDGRVVECARGVHVASRFVWSFTYDIPD